MGNNRWETPHNPISPRSIHVDPTPPSLESRGSDHPTLADRGPDPSASERTSTTAPRLSNHDVSEYIEAITTTRRHGGHVNMPDDAMLAAVIEIQERRSTDLTPGDLEVLRQTALQTGVAAATIINKILRAHGVEP